MNRVTFNYTGLLFALWLVALLVAAFLKLKP